MKFKLKTTYKPTGDQPKAIKQLTDGYFKFPQQTLLGVTGSGKTFTMANLIQKVQKPTLVLAHNKTLAGQLYEEFKEFFPENKVCYFISYYDYYQPESYLPATDTYIEKDTKVNQRIEEYRHEAAASVVSRNDVIVVASVSCIYGLGDPQEYSQGILKIKAGQKISRDVFIRQLIDIQFERNDTELLAGRFRVKGNIIDLMQGWGANIYRFNFEGDKIESIKEIEAQNMKILSQPKEIMIFPASPFVTSQAIIDRALISIKKELAEVLPTLPALEAHRLAKRTRYDLEMIRELGHCKGIENYSRHFDDRKPGEPPNTLLDFFPQDFLIIIDESHQALPQVRGMYEGDKSRKKNLIENGFRLPSAYDNRPLKFDEFEKYLKHVVYTSATPSDYEKNHSGQIVEQIIRPTGLVDPEIFVRPISGQMDDLIAEINKTIEQGNRTLVTTLTKQMAEDLTDYLLQKKIKVTYLHSEVDTLERTEIIADLRRGKYDVLVGINLLREGLDIPEVALIGILDADKESFLRDSRSLIQTIGRAARNVNGKVIMYADKITSSMKDAIEETNRRREIQIEYNKKHKITPQSIIKKIKEKPSLVKEEIKKYKFKRVESVDDLIIELETQMQIAAENLDFEKAIEIRDEIRKLKAQKRKQPKIFIL
ncbi:MAG TPA: excinuclease ABC subunit UvrB [Candidatus Uhrbacteria bacterium]|nr:excinuclease ABC subunit UvrB [Candidatus Uhrbacteria bacterium]